MAGTTQRQPYIEPKFPAKFAHSITSGDRNQLITFDRRRSVGFPAKCANLAGNFLYIRTALSGTSHCRGCADGEWSGIGWRVARGAM
ncbi:unnamed protein product [Anisakis simplex]|uniref:Transposase n=1 Tax=Anisakis simplex TaxID=6269 RepID=A0A0M3JVF8_ANISI|nr:unnamed protein product [Anisakis simplex]